MAFNLKVDVILKVLTVVDKAIDFVIDILVKLDGKGA